MKRGSGWLSWGMLLLAAHLAAVGVLDPVRNIWPPRPDDILWRIVFGAQSLNAVGLVLASLAILAVVGFARQSQVLLITAAILSTIAAVLVGALSGLTALDFFQVRATLVKESVAEWDRNVLLPITTAGFAIVALAVLAIGSLSAARRVNPARREAPAPLVVG